MRGDIPSIEILGVPVARLGVQAALRSVEALCEAPGPGRVYYVNAHTLNLAWTDPAYRATLTAADLVLNDGSGVALAARLRGDRFPANLNGTDLNPLIVSLAARRGWSVYLLGGAPGVAEQAAARLEARHADLRVAGCQHGYFPEDETAAVVEKVRAAGTDILMVALGNPLQERWLQRHLDATGARAGVAVGAFLDFTAGVVPRCPAWMSRLGIEWLYRLRVEPRRMWRRYVAGNPLFVLRALRRRPPR